MIKASVMLLSVMWMLSACSSNDASEINETENATVVDSTEEVSSETKTKESDVKTDVYSITGIEYSVPEDWTEEVSEERLKYYYPEDGMLMVSSDELGGTITDDTSRAEYLEGMTSGLESYKLVSESELTIDGMKAYRYEMKNVISNEEYETTMITFDYAYGVITIFMTTLEDSDEDYSSELENILSSINITEEAILEKEEPVEDAAQGEYYFDGVDLVTEDYMITITDYKIIQPGEDGNKYNDTPVIAFWYDITVSEDATDTEYNPTMPWMMSFEAVQDNDSNIVNKLSVSSHPDNAYLDTQLMTIKPGGTVTNAIAYKLTDLETPVTLTAIGNLFTNEILGNYEYSIQ